MPDFKHMLQHNFSMFEEYWNQSAIPALCEYIKIPNKSVIFDKDWEANGYMDQAMQLIVKWCKENSLNDMRLEVLSEKGRTPLLFIEVPGQSHETILFYGHIDKQPEMSGWSAGKGPWNPVLENGKLYGRGSADDGYSIFTAMIALSVLQKHRIPHPRCMILIESSEESGSLDLEYYLERLRNRIGSPSLVICLDSGAGNYEQLWVTTSLRGMVSSQLNVRVLQHGMHSGLGGGVVPSIFSILRSLLGRIENAETSEITLKELHVNIPKFFINQAHATAEILQDTFLSTYDFADCTQPIHSDIYQLILNRSWKPSLSIVGIDGIPGIKDAGNVTLPALSVKLSLRIPPTLNPESAHAILKRVFESDPLLGASLNYLPLESSFGWCASQTSSFLDQIYTDASQLFFKKPVAYCGEGGSIPFVGKLSEKFPEAQFMITGVLGPLSNAHGPDECLSISFVKKLTACIAYILAAQAHS